MMNKSFFYRLAAVTALAVLYLGFRLVTQAGQGLDAVQNDGYAGTGGVLILLSGITIGWLAGVGKKK